MNPKNNDHAINFICQVAYACSQCPILKQGQACNYLNSKHIKVINKVNDCEC
jgi:hypothetical protein